MNKKIVLFGSLCLILALGLVFVGCKTEYYPEVQTVQFNTLGEPGSVAVTNSNPTSPGTGNTVPSTTVGGTLTVSWDPVDGATGYKVVISRDGKKTLTTIYDLPANAAASTSSLSLSTTNRWTYTRSTYGFSTKPSVPTGVSYAYDFIYTLQSDLRDGTWDIGVIATGLSSDLNSSVGWEKDGGTVTWPATID